MLLKRILICVGLLSSFLWADEVTPPPVSSATVSWDIACEKAFWPTLPNDAFGSQEILTYTVHWGVLKAGYGTIAVQNAEPVEDRPVYHLTMELSSSGLAGAVHKYYEKTNSWLDQGSLLSIRYTKETREGNYARDEHVILDQPCRRFYRHEERLDKGLSKTIQGRLPPDTVDMLGYLFRIRGLPLAEGAHYDLTLLSGDRLWPVTVHVIRRTKVSTPAGWFDCFFLEPVLRESRPDAKLRQLQVWVTADRRHIPVRLRMEANIGHITAELTKQP